MPKKLKVKPGQMSCSSGFVGHKRGGLQKKVQIELFESWQIGQAQKRILLDINVSSNNISKLKNCCHPINQKKKIMYILCQILYQSYR